VADDPGQQEEAHQNQRQEPQQEFEGIEEHAAADAKKRLSLNMNAVGAEREGGPAWIRTRDQGIMSPLL
jgi:hypothetical protein